MKRKHQTWSAIEFLKFSNSWVAHGFLGSQFLQKQGFSFWPVFNASKKVSGYFEIAEYGISRYISRCTFRICIVLYGYKLFLISCVGLKSEKMWNLWNFCVSSIFSFLGRKSRTTALW